MCGIIGYIGEKESLPILLDGLKKLEYRGYDSSGLCIKNEFGLQINKKPGKIEELEKDARTPLMEGNTGIAHTRWATHGIPNEANSHPHTSCNSDIAIVHNGIVENHQSLKKLLLSEGHKFSSETDSEVIAHLIEKFYTGNLEEATVKALSFIEGTFGLAIMHKKENKIIAARRGSTLIVGLGNKEMMVASDATALIKHTNRVIYLNDGEIAVLTKNSFIITDLNGKELNSKIEEIKFNLDQIEKSGFKHFMLKEIYEQPSTLKNTLLGRIKDGKIKITLDLDLEKLKRIIIVACGTSWHSALIGKYLIERLAGIPTEVDYASEFRYRNPLLNEGDAVIAISQSGETADTLAAVREAKNRGIKTIGIVNVVGSTISREVSTGIYIHAGPEIGVASTKAFTSQVASLLLFALYVRQKKSLPLDKELLNEINLLPDKISQVLKSSESIKLLAEIYKDSKNFLYLGRGINFPVALEGALKLKEISYIHAEGYPAAEMKHGPIALIDENMPAFFICTKDHTYEKIISNMEEVKARKGKIIAIIEDGDLNIQRLTDAVIRVPKTHDLLYPILNVIPLQLFAYYIADIRGLNVDKPRNLAKSVTVE